MSVIPPTKPGVPVNDSARHLASASGPRVLVLLRTDAAWSRGILRGFMAVAHERGWTLLHYHPPVDLGWLAREWAPDAAVVGPEISAESLVELAPAALVSVPVDRSQDGIASACIDDARVAVLAAEHLLATGLKEVTTFRFDESPFAVERERSFIARACAGGARATPGWGSNERGRPSRLEDPEDIIAWLRALPKPCGVFTCADAWANAVMRYARAAGVRIPEDIALVGADNDVLECELMSPQLSSVMIPFREAGAAAASLVGLALAGKSIAGERIVVSPVTVVPRRSSELFAIEDPLVAEAVRWIRANSERRLTVPMVARAVGGGRQRLERRFRALLDRTVQEEVRRAHVEVARRLLESSQASLREIAKRSGFTNAALLSVAFQREMGVPPGTYRRRVQKALVEADG